MLRRLARSLALVAAVAIVVPAATWADTGPGINPVDDYTMVANFSFRERGTTWSGIASVEDERISGQRSVSFSFSASGASMTCDAGTPGDPSDDYTGTEYIEFFSTSATIKKLEIPTSLANGSFSTLLTGSRVTLDACSGEIVRSKTEHHSFKLALTAMGVPETSVDVFIVDNGDGTQTEVTQRFASVAATGKAELDGNRVQLGDASLMHTELIPRPLP
jgi:hypothetical protein